MEKKDIKDFIHLYIGCQVSREHKDDRSEKFYEYGKLVGVSASEVEPVRTVSIIDVGLDHQHEWYIDETILNLRPLSSMTEQEALELAKIYSGAPKPKRIIGGRAVVSNMWYFECFDEHHLLIIGTTGEAWYEHYFDKRKEDGHMNIVNSHDATIYLISKGFDLFGLIESGLAIDSTLKPVS